uniref:Uncharacterized protein n=1 Tax=Vespula pensylvanica TaxID=30213 RepID=A0A834UHF7_VESPE|nr:hypothetical protein H0235_001836 [Vespula pensylvanica]
MCMPIGPTGHGEKPLRGGSSRYYHWNPATNREESECNEEHWETTLLARKIIGGIAVARRIFFLRCLFSVDLLFL